METNKFMPAVPELRDRRPAHRAGDVPPPPVRLEIDAVGLASAEAAARAAGAGVGEAVAPSLDSLKWVSIWLPVAAVVCVDLVVREVLEGRLGVFASRLVGISTIALMGTAFAITLFTVLGRMQRKLAGRNRELAALNEMGKLLGGPRDFTRGFNGALDALIAVTGAATAEMEIRSPDSSHEAILIRRGDAWSPGGANGAVRNPELATAPQPRSATIPLRVHDLEVGTMILTARAGRALWIGEGEHFVSSVGLLFASAVHAANLFRDVTERNENSVALHRVGLLMHRLQSIQDVLDTVATQTRELLGSTNACAYVGDHDEPEIVSSGGAVSLFRSRAAAGYDGHVSVPLQIGGNVLGGICVCDAAPAARGERGVELLEGLADVASAAINDCWLDERERRIAILEERERISREMHDSLAQALGYLHLKAKATRDVVPRDAAAAQRALDEMSDVAKEAYADVREGILGLRESVSAEGGLVSALEDYASKFSRFSGVTTTVEISGAALPPLDSDTEVQLIRVVQEALTNIRKHARARVAAIRLAHHERHFSIAIVDDGCGFDCDASPDIERQFGLRTMRERVERVGGQFTIESCVGRGTTVRALLPTTKRGSNGAASRSLG